jgi:hypothetical protein
VPYGGCQRDRGTGDTDLFAFSPTLYSTDAPLLMHCCSFLYSLASTQRCTEKRDRPARWNYIYHSPPKTRTQRIQTAKKKRCCSMYS